jgi:carbonic anhydrase
MRMHVRPGSGNAALIHTPRRSEKGVITAFSRRPFLAGLGACPMCAAAVGVAAAEGAHWTYVDPGNWGADGTYPACSIGDEQSPIDLTGAVRAEIEPPAVSWQPQAFSVVNNGHTIQANASPGSVTTSAGRKYELQQFHFQTPSEHTLDGKRSAMEAHFVHAGEGENLMVIGVFLEAGGQEANRAFSALMAVAPKDEWEAALNAAIDSASLLPKARHFFRYEGSLTTPPCSEVVEWNVFAAPVAVAQSDIARFKESFSMNARPLQPIHRRVLLTN